mmetsp:Transcript_17985/g.35407  ORF Transcript_17985/g.35407 Transcript_17985/m.35407 type:complete len:258 (+) Transcript_17985:824-1597(+)
MKDPSHQWQAAGSTISLGGWSASRAFMTALVQSPSSGSGTINISDPRSSQRRCQPKMLLVYWPSSARILSPGSRILLTWTATVDTAYATEGKMAILRAGALMISPKTSRRFSTGSLKSLGKLTFQGLLCVSIPFIAASALARRVGPRKAPFRYTTSLSSSSKKNSSRASCARVVCSSQDVISRVAIFLSRADIASDQLVCNSTACLRQLLRALTMYASNLALPFSSLLRSPPRVRVLLRVGFFFVSPQYLVLISQVL